MQVVNTASTMSEGFPMD